MPYKIVETSNKIISEINNNILDTRIPIDEDNKERKKKLKKLIEALEILLQREPDNPYFVNLIPKIENLLEFLRSLLRIYNNYKREAPKLSGMDKDLFLTINKGLLTIVVRIKEYLKHITPKIEEVKEGNRHLRDLKLHPYKTRFYVKIKELNPDYTLSVVHPTNEKQAEIQRNRTTEELLRLDIKDPITGAREFRRGDNLKYAGSSVIATNGHHRLYELYRRFLQGRINGNNLVEFMIDTKFIEKR